MLSPALPNFHLPTFIIGGAPRSGTTFLCHLLDKHPNVFIAKPFIPEPKVFLLPSSNGKIDYQKRYASLFKEVTHQSALGEKTSYYLENEEACLRLQKAFRNIKLIFIVREPIARAYSNYLWSCKNRIENLSFEEAIKLEGKRNNPFGPEKLYVRPFDYLSRGNYHIFAERYYKAFDKKNIHFFIFEHIMHDPKKFYRDVQLAIDVDPLPVKDLYTPPINGNPDNKNKLNPQIELKLREIMRPKMESFSKLVGIDIGIWGY